SHNGPESTTGPAAGSTAWCRVWCSAARGARASEARRARPTSWMRCQTAFEALGAWPKLMTRTIPPASSSTTWAGRASSPAASLDAPPQPLPPPPDAPRRRSERGTDASACADSPPRNGGQMRVGRDHLQCSFVLLDELAPKPGGFALVEHRHRHKLIPRRREDSNPHRSRIRSRASLNTSSAGTASTSLLRNASSRCRTSTAHASSISASSSRLASKRSASRALSLRGSDSAAASNSSAADRILPSSYRSARNYEQSIVSPAGLFHRRPDRFARPPPTDLPVAAANAV